MKFFYFRVVFIFNNKLLMSRSLLTILFFVFIVPFATVSANNVLNIIDCQPVKYVAVINNDTIEDSLDQFLDMLSNDINSESCKAMYTEISAFIVAGDTTDIINMARAARLCGYYQSRNNNYDESIQHYYMALKYYEKQGLQDSLIAVIPYTNIALAYHKSSRASQSIEPQLRALEIKESIYGEYSSELVGYMVNFAAYYITMFDYEMASKYCNRGIEIIETEKSGYKFLSKLLLNAGIIYKERGDYVSASLFFERARVSFFEHGELNTQDLIHIYNSLGAIYIENGEKNAAIELYLDAVDYINSLNYTGIDGSSVYSNLAHTYAEIGEFSKAESYYKKSIAYCKENAGKNSYCYLEQLDNLAYFFNYHLKNLPQAYDIYSSLFAEINNADYGAGLWFSVGNGYASVLSELDMNSDALRVLNYTLEKKEDADDKILVGLYVDRAAIYFSMYSGSDSLEYLERSLADYKTALDIVDSLKIDLSGEGGRLNVTERFDYILNMAIMSASHLYQNMESDFYLQLALDYSERAKASTLLASTMESKAIKFHIPDTLAYKEKNLSEKLNLLEAKIFEEKNKSNPDNFLINQAQALKLNTLIERDKLIDYFEENYPGYFKLKHKSSSIKSDNIVDLIGKKTNFLEYYLADSLLYSFVINSDQSKMMVCRIDSAFYDIVKQFRSDIVNPIVEGGARSQFERLTRNGYYLYKVLVKPLEDYLISDRIIIASDDILAYIPYEALISDTTGLSSLFYRNLPFLFKEYDMEYVYSASLLRENKGLRRNIRNNTLVFAPNYSGKAELDSIMLKRQQERGKLNNIPGAKEEAIFVSNLLGGDLFLDSDAMESNFKSEAPGRGIIHLAMHTLLNDTNPMFSKMVFSNGSDKLEDGLLNTYEVYNLDLEASMVVLSSCNTGSGIIKSGEGIISLARGFMYAGVPSVVMSLWEVDDYSATEIVKIFYKNLKKGYSKSKALRKAREKYLSEANQLRSHPYFWCSLVILGDDEALFYNRAHGINLIVLSLILIASILYRIKVRTPRNP